MASKTDPGRYFEDFHVGETLHHATPRTVTVGDVALYTGLTGSRFALPNAATVARAHGYISAPLDDLLTFHMVFGKTVPDVSLNAIANLGYAAGRFHRPVYPGETLSATSEVIGARENANGKTGVVYVRTTGRNAAHEVVLDYIRWVMVRKRAAPGAVTPVVPDLPEAVEAAALIVPAPLQAQGPAALMAGALPAFEEYQVGERIDHVDGMTIEEADHRLATRLYHNTAKVHFNSHQERDGRFGRCIVYGGHVISLARAISYNGLQGMLSVAAINAGTHANPSFAGDTIYAWSEVLDKAALPGRADLGALRLRLVATKDLPCGDFPYKTTEGKYDGAVVLDFDYWALFPRRA